MNHQRSFTLLETIVAIYILLAGVVGSMNLAQQNIGAITLFRHQLIASGLAQEGIELVRNKRDTNALTCYATALGDESCFNFNDEPAPNPNTQNMAGIVDAPIGCINEANGCRVVDPFAANITFTPCSGSSVCAFLLLDSLGRYQYSNGDPTIFDRKITVTMVGGPPRDSGLHDWKVTSKVRWCEKLNCDKVVEVYEVLTPNMSQL